MVYDGPQEVTVDGRTSRLVKEFTSTRKSFPCSSNLPKRNKPKSKLSELFSRDFSPMGEYLRNTRMTYEQYLRSPHWKSLRLEFWQHGPHSGKCCNCSNRNNLHLHHKTYKRIGHENLDDLCLLCERCHDKIHGREKTAGKKSLYRREIKKHKKKRNKKKSSS